MDPKPLFIPLKREFFLAFQAGEKNTEFRRYGMRWNEKTCFVGRKVVLSLGYGKKHRVHGVIVGFERSEAPVTTKAWLDCYGNNAGEAACIRIAVEGQME